MFRGENEVKQDFGKRLGHRELRPFRAEKWFGGRVPRALPWAEEFWPFGLEQGWRAVRVPGLFGAKA